MARSDPGGGRRFMRDGGSLGALAGPALRAGICFCMSLLVSALVAMAEEPSPTSLTPRQARLFSQACAHCHLRPEIEVPVLGVEADWKKRRKRGFESLLSNTINGFGNMPPLGTCGACTESDFRALVSFLALLPEPLSELEGDGDGDGERIGDLEGKESGR